MEERRKTALLCCKTWNSWKHGQNTGFYMCPDNQNQENLQTSATLEDYLTLVI